VTGAEALYADLGHFGKKPIRVAWFSIVMPSLVLNYFGQGALLLKNPAAVKNPFYMMAPDWALIPLLVLATMAAVIASQALDNGRIQCDQASDTAWLLAALQYFAYQRQVDRANLYFLCQLGAVCRHRIGGCDVQNFWQSCRRLWHCSHFGHADHNCSHVLRGSLCLEIPLVAVHRSNRGFLCH
jgi:hypothetical protein